MDRINLRVMVNLSGGNGAEFEKRMPEHGGPLPGRFVVFANVDFTGIGTAGLGRARGRATREGRTRPARRD